MIKLVLAAVAPVLGLAGLHDASVPTIAGPSSSFRRLFGRWRRDGSPGGGSQAASPRSSGFRPTGGRSTATLS